MGLPSPEGLAETTRVGGISPTSADIVKTPTTRTRRSLFGLGVSAAGGTAAVALAAALPGARAAFADPMGDGGGTYVEGQLRELPEGGVEYLWPDGKSVRVEGNKVGIHFQKVIEEPLVDIYTGQPRPAFPLHQELRHYLDMTDASRLVIKNDPSLADRLGKRQPVGIITVNRVDPRQNPESIFVYSDLMMKPTDDPEHPNDIRFSLYFNENYQAGSGTATIGDQIPQQVYSDFYGGLITGRLSQLTQVFKGADPDTRFVSFPDEGGPDTPLWRLYSNLSKLQPFELLTPNPAPTA